MSACLPAFRALGSAFPPSSFSLLAQVKWNVLTNTGASGYVGNARLMRAHWLSLHWMVVIQTAVCVCLFGGGETVPFIPSYYAYYTDWLSSFCSGNQTVAPFQSTTLLLLLFALYPSDTSLSLINQPPPFYPDSLPAHCTRPLRWWERVRARERQRERQDRPALLITLFMPGAK